MLKISSTHKKFAKEDKNKKEENSKDKKNLDGKINAGLNDNQGNVLKGLAENEKPSVVQGDKGFGNIDKEKVNIKEQKQVVLNDKENKTGVNDTNHTNHDGIVIDNSENLPNLEGNESPDSES